MLSRCGVVCDGEQTDKNHIFEVLLRSKIVINECAALLSETLTLMLF